MAGMRVEVSGRAEVLKGGGEGGLQNKRVRLEKAS